MQQLQFQFFWPLTEQIPLDLDYTGCNTRELHTQKIDPNGLSYVIRPNDWTNATITASNLNLDIETTTIKIKETPPFYRRALYSMLGLKWEKK